MGSERSCGASRVGRSTSLAVGLFSVACGGSLESRVEDLRTEQQRRQAELTMLEQRIQAARLEQQRQECRAFVAQLASEVATRKAQCTAMGANYARCVAEEGKRTSNGALLGCAAGLGLTLVSGGLGAGVAATACGAGIAAGMGAAEVTATGCGQAPACSDQDEVLVREVLAARKLPAWPVCP